MSSKVILKNFKDKNIAATILNMKINTSKTNYIMFTWSKADFGTRLNVGNDYIEQVREVKLCGVWLTENLKWEKNTREITRSAFARMSMITKLKYVGVSREDLLDVYTLFVRSLIEYCSVVWHPSLTGELSYMLERI